MLTLYFSDPIRQLDTVDRRNSFTPDVRTVISLSFSEKRVTAVLCKHGFQPLGEMLFVRVGHFHESFELCQQFVRSVSFRYSAVEHVTVVNLIEPQDFVKYVRYIIRAVLAILENRSVRRKNIFEFLVLAHICNCPLDVAAHEKLTYLHCRNLVYNINRKKLVENFARKGSAFKSHPQNCLQDFLLIKSSSKAVRGNILSQRLP